MLVERSVLKRSKIIQLIENQIGESDRHGSCRIKSKGEVEVPGGTLIINNNGVEYQTFLNSSHVEIAMVVKALASEPNFQITQLQTFQKLDGSTVDLEEAWFQMAFYYAQECGLQSFYMHSFQEAFVKSRNGSLDSLIEFFSSQYSSLEV